MTSDDVIRMAREAEFVNLDLCSSELERFAALVAAAEREACAKVCMSVDLAGLAGEPVAQVFAAQLLSSCAKVIRARSTS